MSNHSNSSRVGNDNVNPTCVGNDNVNSPPVSNDNTDPSGNATNAANVNSTSGSNHPSVAPVNNDYDTTSMNPHGTNVDGTTSRDVHPSVMTPDGSTGPTGRVTAFISSTNGTRGVYPNIRGMNVNDITIPPFGTPNVYSFPPGLVPKPTVGIQLPNRPINNYIYPGTPEYDLTNGYINPYSNSGNNQGNYAVNSGSYSINPGLNINGNLPSQPGLYNATNASPVINGHGNPSHHSSRSSISALNEGIRNLNINDANGTHYSSNLNHPHHEGFIISNTDMERYSRSIKSSLPMLKEKATVSDFRKLEVALIGFIYSCLGIDIGNKIFTGDIAPFNNQAEQLIQNCLKDTIHDSYLSQAYSFNNLYEGVDFSTRSNRHLIRMPAIKAFLNVKEIILGERGTTYDILQRLLKIQLHDSITWDQYMDSIQDAIYLQEWNDDIVIDDYTLFCILFNNMKGSYTNWKQKLITDTISFQLKNTTDYYLHLFKNTHNFLKNVKQYHYDIHIKPKFIRAHDSTHGNNNSSSRSNSSQSNRNRQNQNTNSTDQNKSTSTANSNTNKSTNTGDSNSTKQDPKNNSKGKKNEDKQLNNISLNTQDARQGTYDPDGQWISDQYN